ncbi:MAG: hypothetical protein HBSAPP03_21990 [Phycisphaerae bacterium]|nr:MAG: hypothetical protein HBSAPP03_21990 [Phycisphaerae bacterium]
MPRLIRLDAVGPFKIEPAAFPRDDQGNLKPIFICACGLSRTLPMCDGSHKACRAVEQPGILYTYDPVTRQIIDQRPA